MSKPVSIAILGAGLLAVVAASVYTLGLLDGFLKKKPNPLYATPRGTLEEYIRAVLAVDEEAELATASPEARATAERQRGPDKAKRHELLKGKSAMFRDMPIVIDSEKVWGDKAKIRVTQGGPPTSLILYVYTFRLIDGEWKISDIERTGDMRW